MDLITKAQEEYALLDSGYGRKLEQFGDIILDRPDPVVEHKKMDEDIWEQAHARFDNEWIEQIPMPKEWQAKLYLKANLYLAPSKHVGMFPEQVLNWRWIEKCVKSEDRKLNVLNLFGYTGLATVAAAKGGADVTHVDAAKSALTKTKMNLELNGLAEAKVRFIPDDATKFVAREIKRGVKYDGIILDPPAFGKGADGETWELEKKLIPLLELCRQVLSDKPVFVLLNGYANSYTHHTYLAALEDMMQGIPGEFSSGDLKIREMNTDRTINAGMYTRWSNKTIAI